MMTLPFIGKLNTVFIVAVAFGMGVIILAMILHIINAARSKDIEGTWFDVNGVAGLGVLCIGCRNGRTVHDRT